MLSKLKKYILYILAIYAVVGFIILPLVLKPQIIKIVEEQTNAKLSCEKIYFNPFIFNLSLHGVVLSDLQNNKLISFRKFFIDFELYSIFGGAIHLKSIALDEPKIFVELSKNKEVNLLGIVKSSPDTNTTASQETTKTEIPHIIIDKVKLSDGYISYKDFSLKHEFDFSFGRIGFVLKDIDTNDFKKKGAKLRFHTNLGDGGFLDLKGDIGSLEPFAMSGDITFEASKLYTEWKYLQENLNLEVADGKISFKTHYAFNLADLNATKIDKLYLSFDKLRIKPKSQPKDVLNLEHAYVQNATILPIMQKVNVEKVGLDTLNIKVKRAKNGDIDWLDYIKTNFASAQTPEVQEEQNTTTPWDVRVDELALENIALEFDDNGVSPKVLTQLNDLDIYLSNITLAGKEAIPYHLNLQVNKTLECRSQGEIVHANLDIRTQTDCSGFNLVHYRPYIDQAAKQNLKTYDLKLLSAIVGFHTEVNIEEKDKEMVFVVEDTNLSIDKFSIAKRSTRERLSGFKALDISGVNYSTLTNQAGIDTIALNNLYLNGARYKNGKINLDGLVEPKKTKTTKKKLKQKDAKKLGLKLKHFALNNARVSFKDKALPKSVTSRLDRIYLNAYGIDIAKNSWLKYKFSMRVNKKGYVKSRGSLRHTPLKQKGSLELKQISLTELTPYIQEKAYVSIDDGTISLKTKTSYSVSKTKPDLSVNGSFNLNNLYVTDSRDESPLIAFSDVDLKAFTFELFPNRLYIDTMDIGSFYVDVLIDEKKQLNFAKLVKVEDTNTTQETVTEEVATAEDVNTTNEPSFPIKIAKINISEGNTKFADLSIPIQFRTNIHNLNGEIYSVGNVAGETTFVNLKGDVDEYGSTKLKGSINSANPKEFTDLSFNFKNLELNAMSGYSASFAGYEIDSGKLYLDLGYKINNSQLQGANSVIIKQIKLGKESEDENVTKLPLGFVIALLEDSDGIIDIDMPVEGNLDEPDFKYGALVWKTIGNLIAKAVSSPFKFLGSMMGMDGDSLEYAEFEAGSTEILPTEKEKLDNIAKMMLKRPKIDLAIAPTYDAVVDKEALQLNKLIALVMEKSGIKNTKDHKNAMTIDMLEDIYDELQGDEDLLDNTKEKLEKEYEDKEDEFDRAYLLTLIDMTRSLQVVSEADLIALANAREKILIEYLVQEKNIEPQRVLHLELQKVDGSENKLVQMKLQVEVK